MACRPLEAALERRTVEKEAAVAELQAASAINATRQAQVWLMCCTSADADSCPNWLKDQAQVDASPALINPEYFRVLLGLHGHAHAQAVLKKATQTAWSSGPPPPPHTT